MEQRKTKEQKRRAQHWRSRWWLQEQEGLEQQLEWQHGYQEWGEQHWLEKSELWQQEQELRCGLECQRYELVSL